MNTASWLTLAGVCITGAMSPGPSLALVLARTLQGGRRAGALAAVGHGLGVGVYAGVAVGGLAVALIAAPTLFLVLQLAGAVFLGVMAWGLLRDQSPSTVQERPSSHPFRDGFLLAFLNPKIAVFFLALFSQLVDPTASAIERAGMAALAGFIDTGWYLLVALVLGGSRWMGWLSRHRTMVDRGMGLLLLGLAGWVVKQAVWRIAGMP